MSLVHGGGSFPVLSPSVFKFVCGTSPADITPGIEEVHDMNTKTFLEQVLRHIFSENNIFIFFYELQIYNCSDVNELREMATTNIDLLIKSGFMKPTSLLDICDKKQIIQSVALDSVIVSSLAELTQFREGIYSVPGMRNALQNHSDLLEAYYCNNHQVTLTAGKSKDKKN